jgi:hypothetical protein
MRNAQKSRLTNTVIISLYLSLFSMIPTEISTLRARALPGQQKAQYGLRLLPNCFPDMEWLDFPRDGDQNRDVQRVLPSFQRKEGNMTRRVLMLLIVAAGAAGCTPAYTVHVNTYSEIKEPLSQTTPIYVSTDPNSRNPILADAIASKVRTLLEEHGYTVAEKAEGAGHVLTFRAGIDSARVMDYMPVSRPFGGFYGRYGGGFRGLGYGYTSDVPYTETVYVHWMEMRLLAQGQNVKDKTRPVWIGEAVVGRSDAELRDSVNYLLIGLFEYFGADTERWVSMTIEEDDPRIQGLTETQ